MIHSLRKSSDLLLSGTPPLGSTGRLSIVTSVLTPVESERLVSVNVTGGSFHVGTLTLVGFSRLFDRPVGRLNTLYSLSVKFAHTNPNNVSLSMVFIWNRWGKLRTRHSRPFHRSYSPFYLLYLL